MKRVLAGRNSAEVGWCKRVVACVFNTIFSYKVVEINCYICQICIKYANTSTDFLKSTLKFSKMQ